MHSGNQPVNSRAIITAVAAALCMGTMGVFSRMTGFDATVITFFRLLIGALFLLSFLVVRKKLRLLRCLPGVPVVASGAFLAGLIIFYVQAMNLTTMANAVMVLYLAPLAASVFAHYFLREKLGLTGILLICGALFGFAMMLEFRFGTGSGVNDIRGLVCALLSLICYSGFIVVNRTIDPRVHVYTRTFYQLLAGAICLVPFLADNIPPLNLTNGLWLIGTGFIPGFLGILFAVSALEKLPAATFGTLAYFEPIFVILLGWLLFHENLSALQMAGCTIIIGCGITKGFIETRPTVTQTT